LLPGLLSPAKNGSALVRPEIGVPAPGTADALPMAPRVVTVPVDMPAVLIFSWKDTVPLPGMDA
jgi:hypothetical protein